MTETATTFRDGVAHGSPVLKVNRERFPPTPCKETTDAKG